MPRSDLPFTCTASAQFYLFSHTKLPIKQQATGTTNPNPISPGAHLQHVPYKRSPLSTPLHSRFDPLRPATPYGDATYSMMVRQHQTPYHDALHMASDRLVERYNALVIERLGEDLGTLFRRHLLKQLRPSAVHGSGLKRSHSVSLRKGDSQPAGWDEETIVWLGCHALKRLEWVHSKGLVHRDIVSRSLC